MYDTHLTLKQGVASTESALMSMVLQTSPLAKAIDISDAGVSAMRADSLMVPVSLLFTDSVGQPLDGDMSGLISVKEQMRRRGVFDAMAAVASAAIKGSAVEGAPNKIFGPQDDANETATTNATETTTDTVTSSTEEVTTTELTPEATTVIDSTTEETTSLATTYGLSTSLAAASTEAHDTLTTLVENATSQTTTSTAVPVTTTLLGNPTTSSSQHSTSLTTEPSSTTTTTTVTTQPDTRNSDYLLSSIVTASTLSGTPVSYPSPSPEQLRLLIYYFLSLPVSGASNQNPYGGVRGLGVAMLAPTPSEVSDAMQLEGSSSAESALDSIAGNGAIPLSSVAVALAASIGGLVSPAAALQTAMFIGLQRSLLCQVRDLAPPPAALVEVKSSSDYVLSTKFGNAVTLMDSPVMPFFYATSGIEGADDDSHERAAEDQRAILDRIEATQKAQQDEFIAQALRQNGFANNDSALIPSDAQLGILWTLFSQVSLTQNSPVERTLNPRNLEHHRSALVGNFIYFAMMTILFLLLGKIVQVFKSTIYFREVLKPNAFWRDCMTSLGWPSILWLPFLVCIHGTVAVAVCIIHYYGILLQYHAAKNFLSETPELARDLMHNLFFALQLTGSSSSSSSAAVAQSATAATAMANDWVFSVKLDDFYTRSSASFVATSTSTTEINVYYSYNLGNATLDLALAAIALLLVVVMTVLVFVCVCNVRAATDMDADDAVDESHADDDDYFSRLQKQRRAVLSETDARRRRRGCCAALCCCCCSRSAPITVDSYGEEQAAKQKALAQAKARKEKTSPDASAHDLDLHSKKSTTTDEGLVVSYTEADKLVSFPSMTLLPTEVIANAEATQAWAESVMSQLVSVREKCYASRRLALEGAVRRDHRVKVQAAARGKHILRKTKSEVHSQTQKREAERQRRTEQSGAERRQREAEVGSTQEGVLIVPAPPMQEEGLDDTLAPTIQSHEAKVAHDAQSATPPRSASIQPSLSFTDEDDFLNDSVHDAIYNEVFGSFTLNGSGDDDSLFGSEEDDEAEFQLDAIALRQPDGPAKSREKDSFLDGENGDDDPFSSPEASPKEGIAPQSSASLKSSKLSSKAIQPQKSRNFVDITSITVESPARGSSLPSSTSANAKKIAKSAMAVAALAAKSVLEQKQTKAVVRWGTYWFAKEGEWVMVPQNSLSRRAGAKYARLLEDSDKFIADVERATKDEINKHKRGLTRQHLEQVVATQKAAVHAALQKATAKDAAEDDGYAFSSPDDDFSDAADGDAAIEALADQMLAEEAAGEGAEGVSTARVTKALKGSKKEGDEEGAKKKVTTKGVTETSEERRLQKLVRRKTKDDKVSSTSKPPPPPTDTLYHIIAYHNRRTHHRIHDQFHFFRHSAVTRWISRHQHVIGNTRWPLFEPTFVVIGGIGLGALDGLIMTGIQLCQIRSILVTLLLLLLLVIVFSLRVLLVRFQQALMIATLALMFIASSLATALTFSPAPTSSFRPEQLLTAIGYCLTFGYLLILISFAFSGAVLVISGIRNVSILLSLHNKRRQSVDAAESMKADLLSTAARRHAEMVKLEGETNTTTNKHYSQTRATSTAAQSPGTRYIDPRAASEESPYSLAAAALVEGKVDYTSSDDDDHELERAEYKIRKFYQEKNTIWNGQGNVPDESLEAIRNVKVILADRALAELQVGGVGAELGAASTAAGNLNGFRRHYMSQQDFILKDLSPSSAEMLTNRNHMDATRLASSALFDPLPSASAAPKSSMLFPTGKVLSVYDTKESLLATVAEAVAARGSSKKSKSKDANGDAKPDEKSKKRTEEKESALLSKDLDGLAEDIEIEGDDGIAYSLAELLRRCEPAAIEMTAFAPPTPNKSRSPSLTTGFSPPFARSPILESCVSPPVIHFEEGHELDVGNTADEKGQNDPSVNEQQPPASLPPKIADRLVSENAIPLTKRRHEDRIQRIAQRRREQETALRALEQKRAGLSEVPTPLAAKGRSDVNVSSSARGLRGLLVEVKQQQLLNIGATKVDPSSEDTDFDDI